VDVAEEKRRSPGGGTASRARRRRRGAAGLRPVSELMRRHFVTIGPEESLLDAYRLMRMARLRHVMVTRDGELCGTLSYRDLLEGFLVDPEGATQKNAHEMHVEEAMVADPYTLTPDTPLEGAASRLLRLRVGCLPVVDASGETPQLVGLVTESDLLRAAFGDAPPEKPAR